MNLPLFEHDRPPAITAALRELAAAGGDERGAVFTRRELVEFMLDLVGYTVDRPLHAMRVLEPSFGGGDFLLPVIERLLEAWDHHGRPGDLLSSLVAVEIHHATYDATYARVVELLRAREVQEVDAHRLADHWLHRDDFLLADLGAPFDLVVGNPPYVRIERIPKVLLEEYRTRFTTMFDRADLYIPFIERSLDHLAAGGVLAFVCANRWHKNKYGGPLREKVADAFHLQFHVDLVGVDAFDREVIAYPAITVIRRGQGTRTVIARRPEIERARLAHLKDAMLAPERHAGLVDVACDVASGRSPWLLHDPGKLALLRRLERDFPTIEDAGCAVGIGVATGRDDVFIRPMDDLDVEPERKLPLIKAPDIRSGRLDWGGLGLLNPFDEAGRVVSLDDWPRFAAFVRRHEAELRRRSVARRTEHWYRTIDKVHPWLRGRPKLLIPDIKGEPHVVYDPGEFYPHHNLYWVTSEDWNLHALQTILGSDVARLVIEAYCVEMAGGYLRFQAQYLRRIPIPRWTDLDGATRSQLVAASSSSDDEVIHSAVAAAYGLSSTELEVLLRPA